MQTAASAERLQAEFRVSSARRQAQPDLLDWRLCHHHSGPFGQEERKSPPKQICHLFARDVRLLGV